MIYFSHISLGEILNSAILPRSLLQDPNKNKIKQWRGEHDVSGVVTKYLDLDTQPVIGDWKIKVTCHVSTLDHTLYCTVILFCYNQVVIYIPPKFLYYVKRTVDL